MTFAEINRKYTEIISAYLANGYIINAGTMGGSQGEITKVDLTNGQHILRVLIKRGFCTDDSCWLDTLEIVVGVAEPAVLPNKGSSRYDTVWNDKLTILREDRFYKVGTVRRGLDAGESFYGTKAEAEAAQRKHFSRYTANKPADNKKGLYGVRLRNRNSVHPPQARSQAGGESCFECFQNRPFRLCGYLSRQGL